MNGYEYYAFVCYVHKDEKLAHKIFREMDEFHIPTLQLHENSSLLNHGRTSIDESDGSNISAHLKAAILSSKYLIVLCTTNAVLSNWVSQAINIFIEAGRFSDIIPVVYTGVSGVKLPIEAFYPYELRNAARLNELNPVNLDIMGKEKGVIFLVARMLMMHPDSLWIKVCRKRQLYRALLFVSSVLILLLSLLYFDYTRVEYRYYANMNRCWGMPIGVNELSKEEVSHSSRMYRFEYRRPSLLEGFYKERRLSSVAFTNSLGMVRSQIHIALNEEERCPILKIEYRKDKLYAISYCDAFGRMEYRHILVERGGTEAGMAIRSWAYGNEGVIVTSLDMINEQRTIQIPYYLYERDKDGYVSRRSFHLNNDRDERSSIIRGVNDSYGFSIERDFKHLPVCYTYLDADLNPTIGKWGVSRIRRQYNEQGLCTKVWYESKDSDLVYVNSLGYAMASFQLDQYGNCLEIRYYDDDGNLSTAREGYAMTRMVYDKNGMMTEQFYYDDTERPCFAQDGAALIRYRYDEKGNCIERAYYDTEIRPCINRYGYACINLKYDKQNRVIEENMTGIDGLSCMCKEGYSKKLLTYDNAGNVIDRFTYDLYDHLTPTADSIWGSHVLGRYDENNQCIALENYDENAKPFVGLQGFRITAKYDSQFNEIERCCYDEKGHLMISDDWKCAKITFEYDVYGNMSSCHFFGDDGRPLVMKEGMASVNFEYEDCSYFSKISGHDVDGHLCNGQDGFAYITIESLDSLFMEYRHFYNDKGQAVSTPKHGATTLIVYDRKLERVKEAYFNANNEPMCNVFGVHCCKLDYDKRGNAQCVSYYDASHHLVKNSQLGYAQVKSEYDAAGRCIAQYYYDAFGQQCANKQGYAYWKAVNNGIDREVFFYDNTGNIIERL